jgi:hypothetical protein
MKSYLIPDWLEIGSRFTSNWSTTDRTIIDFNISTGVLVVEIYHIGLVYTEIWNINSFIILVDAKHYKHKIW